jgi:heme A synthase
MKCTLYYKFPLFATMLVATVVLPGAYTRLVDSGLGIWTVAMGLLAVVDTGHLIGGFTTLALLWLLLALAGIAHNLGRQSETP